MKKQFKTFLSVFLAVVFCCSGMYLPATSMNASAAGNTVSFGSYPQSKVTDTALINALNAVDAEWTTCGSAHEHIICDCMDFKDITYNGVKYRGVKLNSARPVIPGTSVGDDIIVTNQSEYYAFGTTHWFKYEPLIWEVVDANTGLLKCTKAIDAQGFSPYFTDYDEETGTFNAYAKFEETDFENETEAYANTWGRYWLNNIFCSTAFDQQEQNNLTGAVTAYNPYGDNIIFGDGQQYDGTDYATCIGYGNVKVKVNGIKTKVSYKSCWSWDLTGNPDISIKLGIINLGSSTSDLIKNAMQGYMPVLCIGGVTPAIYCDPSAIANNHVHTYSNWTTETPATCTTDGTEVRYCTVCNESFSNTVYATGHDMGEWNITSATCTEAGYQTRYCSACDYSETETISASGHTDANNDNLCDICGVQIEELSSPIQQFIQTIIAIINSIIDFFTNLFS